jgi:cephalosporin-C deacetylase-like acetyl esterase
MRRLIRWNGSLLWLLCVASIAVSAEKESKLVVQVATDRPDAIYQAGEEVKFLVKVSGGSAAGPGQISYVLDNDGAKELGQGSVENSSQPAAIAAKMANPGFLRCRVTYKSPEGKTATGMAAAAVSPEKIATSLPVPDDFDAFWAAQKAELAKEPLEPKLTPVNSPNPKIECFDVQVPCVDGVPVSGYFARPKGAAPKSLPIVLWVHGAGVRSASLGGAIGGADKGMLSMDINAHGIPNGQPAEFYKKLSENELKDYRYRGRERRETCYFRAMFLRLVRAIDFLTAQPEWNGKVVAVVGHSQGGGQALAAGGLDRRVTFIGVGVPAICDHTGVAAGRINGWPKLVPNGPDGKPDAAVLQASRYFDGVNFASRYHGEAIMSVGFVDVTCPPTTCYAAYNQLRGKKQVINEPAMGHAAPPHIHAAFLKAMLDHLQQR